MVARKPLVTVSGSISELPPGDTVTGTAVGILTAGSGLTGGGDLSSNQRVDIALAPNASGLIFVGDSLGIDGVVQVVAETALASGNAALVSAATKLSLSGGSMTGPITFGSGQLFSDPQIVGNITFQNTSSSVGAISDSTSTTSSTTAASSTAVKSAYDLALAAVPKSLVDAKGDLLVGTANDTVSRLGVGSNGQILTADSAQAGGMKWADAAGGGSLVFISSINASGASTAAFTSGITSTYNNYKVFGSNIQSQSSARLIWQVSTNSGASWTSVFIAGISTAVLASSINSATDIGYVFSSEQIIPVSTDSNASAAFEMTLLGLPSTGNAFKRAISHGTADTSQGYAKNFISSHSMNTTSAINGIRFIMDAGTFQGNTTFYLYGIKQS